MPLAEAILHVAGLRVLEGSKSALLPLFVEGPVIAGIHIIGVLDRSRLAFEAQLYNAAGQSGGACTKTIPPTDPAPRVIELAFLTCALPPGPLLAGKWLLQVRWISGPAAGRVYKVPIALCKEPAFSDGTLCFV